MCIPHQGGQKWGATFTGKVVSAPQAECTPNAEQKSIIGEIWAVGEVM